ncbi:hypothetical protein H4219_000377 [Mycoemilia scoparia]|uniref:Uncharacterized protein n=1 Tax=Mycoemilia scoparia TaxID=417184 RepID=A0A9W8DXJ7_9FUNG|nr:hypothetical protein H4219_000377 [Mycoemilia scoparia]
MNFQKLKVIFSKAIKSKSSQDITDPAFYGSRSSRNSQGTIYGTDFAIDRTLRRTRTTNSVDSQVTLVDDDRRRNPAIHYFSAMSTTATPGSRYQRQSFSADVPCRIGRTRVIRCY